MKRNMGGTDRSIRLAGAAILAAFCYNGLATGTVAWVFTGIAILLVVTSIAGICPLYNLFEWDTLSVNALNLDADYRVLLRQGAVIVDVRSPMEFRLEHLAGSINIPIDELQASLCRLPGKGKPVVFCSSTGRRSLEAFRQLSALGYPNVYNGGRWTRLRRFLREPQSYQQTLT